MGVAVSGMQGIYNHDGEGLQVIAAVWAAHDLPH